LQESLRQQEMENKIAQQQRELQEMRRATLLNPSDGTELADLPQRPVAQEEEAPASRSAKESNAQQAKIKQLEDELARLRTQKELAEQENDLLTRKDAEKRDATLESLNQVEEARLVGKVTSFDYDKNILVFMPIGQPSLKNGEELAIRRRGGILVLLDVEELDPDSGCYIASVKSNELANNARADGGIVAGDEVIVPPASIQGELPELDPVQPTNTDLEPIPMTPDYPSY
jgi:hypothetical protein